MRSLAPVLALTLCGILLAGASPRPRSAASGTLAAGPVSRTGMKGKAPRTLKFDPLKIEGHIPKPQAIYSLERSHTSFGDLEIDDDFVPKIVESVDREPF